ncbi:unknown [Bacteroides sp. CAG:927]|nr:unknown [Bacteroides sp. CAG:927]
MEPAESNKLIEHKEQTFTGHSWGSRKLLR